jgi:hypothetical protein
VETVQEVEDEGQADQQDEREGEVETHDAGAYQTVEAGVNLPSVEAPSLSLANP